MKRLMSALVAMAALLTAPVSVSAISCPPGFHLHAIEDGDHEHGQHRHVGLTMDLVDLNGNGYICVKHITPDGTIHVHVDDVI